MKDDRVYLHHIRDSLGWIAAFGSEGRETFLRDRKTQDAVLRNLEVIGEAVKQRSAEFKDAHPEVPWRRIAGLRDKLIHDYFGVNLELVWDVVIQDVPRLRVQIEAMLGTP